MEGYFKECIYREVTQKAGKFLSGMSSMYTNFLIRFLPHKISIDYDTARPLSTVTGIFPLLFAEFNTFLIVTECWNLNKEFDSPRFISLLSMMKIKK